MSEPILSIVAGTYNRRDQLIRLVESVRRETKYPHVLYVTDAGSDDGTIEYLRSVACETVRPIFVGELLGQARAYNDVFFSVDTPYVCWLSDDNEIVNGGLDRAVDILKAKNNIGMVGLKVRDKIGPFTDAPYIGGISTLGILNVNQGMLPTRVLHAAGGFCENFRDYGIDPDLTAKVLFMGFDVAYTRDVAIHHYRNWNEEVGSKEHTKLKRKHDRALALYESQYEPYAKPSMLWSQRKKLWNFARNRLARKLDLNVNSTSTILGAIPRDWYNALHGRFINPLDPLLRRGRDYHLIQRYRGSAPAYSSAAPTGEPAGANA